MHSIPQKIAQTSVLDDLIPATWDHYKSYYDASERVTPTGFSYYYPALLAYQRSARRLILFSEDAGSLCIYRLLVKDGRRRLDLYLAPKPMNEYVLRRCLERTNDFNGDRKARILRVDESDAPLIADAGLRIRERNQQFIFSPANYGELGGKSLYTVRRQVARVEKLGDVHIEPYKESLHSQGCHTLLRKWGKEHRDRHGTTGGVGYTRNILALADKLPAKIMSGQVVLIDGQVAAFAFGGAIHQGLACSYERKCDTSISGLTYFQLRQFLLHLGDYEFVNDGSDAKRPGLRQLKQSFRPVRMHQEFRAYQR